jgi:hypothetical protein
MTQTSVNALKIIRQAYGHPQFHMVRFNHATQCARCGCEFLFKLGEGRYQCQSCFSLVLPRQDFEAA